MTAAEKFELVRVATVEVNGVEWVVYSDDLYTYAVTKESWELEPGDSMDYSDWCSRTISAGDHDLCLEIVREAGIVGINAAGDCAWITP